MRLFRDRRKLSPRYIPDRLPHRERQIEELLMFFPDVESDVTTVVQLVGVAGSGKTSTAVNVARILEKKGLRYAYVNMKTAQSKFLVYKSLVDCIEPDLIKSRSISPEEVLRKFLKELRKRKLRVFVIFDEIEYYIRSSRDTSIIYDFTRLNEVFMGQDPRVLGVVLISRELRWRDYLDPAERSSLGNLVLNFPPYKREEVEDILYYRIEEAFHRGAVTDEVVDYVAEVTVSDANGDIRYALDILLYAGILAENEGAEKVTVEHVRKVLSQLNPYITTEELLLLSDKEKLILLALAYQLRKSGEPYTSFTELYDEYKDVCEVYGHGYNIRSFENHLQSLIDKGIIELKGVKRVGINVPTTRLIPFLERIIENLASEMG